MFCDTVHTPISILCTGTIIHVYHWFCPQVLHYVEKPETFVSNVINAGAYIFSPDIFKYLARVFTANYENELMYVQYMHIDN